MKKIILAIILFSFCSNAHAVITRPCGEALNWWIKEQGKSGPFRTTSIAGTSHYKILDWRVKDLARPNDLQVEAIINEYLAQYVPPKTVRELLEDLDLRVKALEKP